jgi:uncharacterized damage-inducible protein DinB
MISLETSLHHMAWSNQKVFTYFSAAPEEVFGLRTAEDEWPVGELLTHLASSAEWYRYCLTGVLWTDLKPITNGAVAAEYLGIMAELDQLLVDQANLSDEDLVIEADGETIHATRSLILSQAIVHAAEHKGQIATILKQHGHHLDLDYLDVWVFMSDQKAASD